MEEEEETREADWKATLKVGDKVDVIVTVNCWLVATVKVGFLPYVCTTLKFVGFTDIRKDYKKDYKKIHIHYDGYETRWDEWMDLDSDRLAKKGAMLCCLKLCQLITPAIFHSPGTRNRSRQKT